MEKYEEQLAAAQTINDFMGKLAEEYSFEDFKKAWDTMDLMRIRYGDVFVAAAIRKDPVDAELALIRYRYAGHRHCWHPDPEQEEAAMDTTTNNSAMDTVQQPSAHWVRVHPKQRGFFKRAAVLLGIGTLTFATIISIQAGSAIANSDRIIAEADRILEETER